MVHSERVGSVSVGSHSNCGYRPHRSCVTPFLLSVDAKTKRVHCTVGVGHMLPLKCPLPRGSGTPSTYMVDPHELHFDQFIRFAWSCTNLSSTHRHIGHATSTDIDSNKPHLCDTSCMRCDMKQSKIADGRSGNNET